LPNAQIEEVEKQIMDLCGISQKEIYKVSAKTGEGVEELLWAVIEKIPSPIEDDKKPLRALVLIQFMIITEALFLMCVLVDGEVRGGETGF